MGFSYGAPAYMHGAHFGMRVAEDGQLTFLKAHAALRRMGARHVTFTSAVAAVGCCCCHPTYAWTCHRGLQGPCIERGPCLNYLQDRALII
jgi:hypothetical protein